jgi:hypothetical protein
MDQETLRELSMISSMDLEIRHLDKRELQDFAAFRSWLIAVIQHLIDQDFGHLVNLLYKIDVSEMKAKAAFADHDDPAAKLADLIIERELKKVETRKKYRAR